MQQLVRIMRAVFWIGLLGLIVGLPSPLQALEIPVIKYFGADTPLNSYALIRDPQHKLTRDQVFRLLERGQFSIQAQNALDNYGYTNDVLWVAFRVTNQTVQGSNSFIDVQSNDLQNVSIFIRRNLSVNIHVWTEEQSGSTIPIYKRPIPVSALNFGAAIPPLTDAVVLCRVEHKGALHFHIDYQSAPRIFDAQETRNAIIQAYLGALVALMGFNILLFAFMRDRNFFWFILHVLSATLYVFAASGIGFKYLWPIFPGFQLVAAPIFAGCIILTALVFVRQYFETALRFCKFNLVLLLNGLGIVFFLILLAIDNRLGMMVGGILLLISIFSLFISGFLRRIFEITKTRFLVSAFICLMIGAALSQTASFATFINGWPLIVLNRGDYVGIFCEAFLLSFTLSAKLQTLRRQKEEAEAKNRLKQSFIANVSHEMRTPLNAIIGFAESIQDLSDPELMRRFNNRILSESERLLFQINQVLDLAKLESDHLMIDVGPFSLTESLDYLDSVFRSQAQAKCLDLRFASSGTVPAILIGDRLRIEQVIRNLVDNAIKFTEAGSVSINVDCQEESPGMVNLTVSVRDTGIGIPMNKQAEIFEEFVQADSSITRRFGGTGLGTSISRKLIHAMGGTLKLNSQLSEGSEFSFGLVLPVGEVPVIRSNNASTSCVEDMPYENAGITNVEKRPRILVVDDFETNRQVVCIHLSRFPVDIDTACNGPEALDQLYREKYDLVLLDIFMPGLSGHDVVRIIRERWSTSELPVLGLTASGELEDTNSALSAGMNGVMIKPVKRQDLIAQIRQYLPNL